MRMRFVWRGTVRLAVMAMLVLAALAPRPGFAQEPLANETAAIEAARLSLDQVERAMREHMSLAELANERAAVSSAREILNGVLQKLEPRLTEVQDRVKQLGPAPAKDAPPEAAALTAERAQLAETQGAIDAAVKQSRLLLVRSDQLVERISARRNAMSAREILKRSPSVLDPGFWIAGAAGIPAELAKLREIAADWSAAASDWRRLILALACLAAFFFAVASLRRWWRRRYASHASTTTRFAKARAALWVFISIVVLAPVVTWVTLKVLDLFGLWPAQLGDASIGLLMGVTAAAFARGAARGLFAPERPERRLIPIGDDAAACLTQHVTWSARILGAAVALQLLHKSLAAPIETTLITSALFALAIAATWVHLVLRLRYLEEERGAAGGGGVPWVRPIGWLIAAGIVLALVLGFVGLAGFMALRTLVAVVLGATLYLWLVAADALFTDALNPETARGRALAANLGITPRNAGLMGTLLSAAIRIVLVVLFVTVIVGPWEASTVDLIESIQAVPLGFKIGEITVSFRGLLSGIVVLLVALAATRVSQRWLQSRLLPLTTLEPSLQLSITTIFGYLGVIIALALTLGALGIDLQKIAIVAGALSVGIGFGLQSIVSNFVSGLILLAERPIRVGDSIVVKGEEGWVRRIRVRATEIETFERASVIIPNSELITGLVKNWTHVNTMGRVIVKVAVGFHSDPDQVREILEAIATDNAQIVKAPAPRAFLVGFGDNALNFELRCVIANVDQGLSVRSDLHVAILKRFRAAGIEMPVAPIAAEPRTSAKAAPPAAEAGAT